MELVFLSQLFASVVSISLRCHFREQDLVLCRSSSTLLAKPWWMFTFLRGVEFGPLPLFFWPQLCLLKICTHKLRYNVLLTPALAKTRFNINICFLSNEGSIQSKIF